MKILIGLSMIVMAACGDRVTTPTPAVLTIEIPAAITARVELCPTCSPAFPAVAEFPVTITDASGRGGTVESVETRIQNVSRNALMALNLRPNRDVGYENVTLAGAGRLVLQAGVVFDVPPPRDEVWAIVTVRLTDGRMAVTSARVTVLNEAPR